MKNYERPEDGWKPMKDEVWRGRIKRLADTRTEMMKKSEEELLAMVTLNKGNKKTGAGYFTVSLCPVIDCPPECVDTCAKWCYATQSVIIMKQPAFLMAVNSALHAKNPMKFWHRVSDLVGAECCGHLRINVAGDICFTDLPCIAKMARRHRKTVFHLFTKNYEAVNAYLAAVGPIPKNVRLIFSRWPGLPCDNRYGIPECHVDFGDGLCEAPAGSAECGGNCTACAFNGTGCHGLKKGEAVVIKYHTNSAFAIQKNTK